MSKQIIIIAAGGTTFQVSVQDGEDREFLGSMEFGSISEDGQYEQDDDEIIDAVRENFGLDESMPAVVR